MQAEAASPFAGEPAGRRRLPAPLPSCLLSPIPPPKQVWVHVADPSRWVAPGSALAREACARSKSMYLPTGVVPMFPKCLAEGPFRWVGGWVGGLRGGARCMEWRLQGGPGCTLAVWCLGRCLHPLPSDAMMQQPVAPPCAPPPPACSLRQGLPTEAVSVGARLSPGGALLADTVEVVPSRVAPARRLTYVDVDEMLVECDAEQEPDLFALQEVRRGGRCALRALSLCSTEAGEREELAAC